MLEIAQTSITITAFVLQMMLIIEYINIKTQGQWNKPLKKNLFLQILTASLLGAVPGCLGTYTVVSLFTHKVIGFGALVSAMIATAGDEAFVMFGLMPDKAVLILLVSFVIAIVTGLVISLFHKNKSVSEHQFMIHSETQSCTHSGENKPSKNLKTISFLRGLILFALILFGVDLFVGTDHHQHSFDINQEVFSNPTLMDKAPESHQAICLQECTEHQHQKQSNSAHTHFNLPKIFFLILTLISIYIVLTCSEHFINEHIWNHVVKKHFFKIFLWTFGTLLLIFAIKNYFTIDFISLTNNNIWLVLVLAVLIGIIPESGPHMVFISLFISGAIPLSILLANSIVQDGHGALPLFAEDKKSFFKMKSINVAVGLMVGVLGVIIGF